MLASVGSRPCRKCSMKNWASWGWIRPRGWCCPWSNNTMSTMEKFWHTKARRSPKKPKHIPRFFSFLIQLAQNENKLKEKASTPWSLPIASPVPGVKMLLVWESLWINWAMLSVSFWGVPREPIIVDRTPCTIPVKSSGFKPSPGAAAPEAVAAFGGAVGAVGVEVGGCPEGGWEKSVWEAWWQRCIKLSYTHQHALQKPVRKWQKHSFFTLKVNKSRKPKMANESLKMYWSRSVVHVLVGLHNTSE